VGRATCCSKGTDRGCGVLSYLGVFLGVVVCRWDGIGDGAWSGIVGVFVDQVLLIIFKLQIRAFRHVWRHKIDVTQSWISDERDACFEL
jgi:hypothetical protein